MSSAQSSGGGSVPPPSPSSPPVPVSSAPPPSSVSPPAVSSTEPPSSSTTPSSTPPSSSSAAPIPTSTPDQTSSTPPPQPSQTSQVGPTPTNTRSSSSAGNGNTQSPSSVTPSLSSTSTSVFTSVWVTTGTNGQVVTTTLRSTVIVTPTSSANSGGGSSNTGAIVGGIVGGLAALAFILLIGLFCWRRSRRRSEDFDGNFDPDRVTGHAGHTDLAGAEVTPYSYEPGVAGAALAHSGPSTGAPSSSGNGSMRQYRDSQALLAGGMLDAGAATATSGSHYAPTSSDSASAYPSSLAHSSQHGVGMPVPQPYNPLSAKEREALRQRGGSLGLASAMEEEEVIQHTDGGQIPDPSVATPRPHEVPPSYDSIPGNG